MNLHQLTTPEVGKAHDAADHLWGLRGDLEPVLFVKLDGFRADLKAAIEDRVEVDAR